MTAIFLIPGAIKMLPAGVVLEIVTWALFVIGIALLMGVIFSKRIRYFFQKTPLIFFRESVDLIRGEGDKPPMYCLWLENMSGVLVKQGCITIERVKSLNGSAESGRKADLLRDQRLLPSRREPGEYKGTGEISIPPCGNGAKFDFMEIRGKEGEIYLLVQSNEKLHLPHGDYDFHLKGLDSKSGSLDQLVLQLRFLPSGKPSFRFLYP